MEALMEHQLRYCVGGYSSVQVDPRKIWMIKRSRLRTNEDRREFITDIMKPVKQSAVHRRNTKVRIDLQEEAVPTLELTGDNDSGGPCVWMVGMRQQAPANPEYGKNKQCYTDGGEEHVPPTKSAGDYAKHIFREYYRLAHLWGTRSADGGAQTHMTTQKEKGGRTDVLHSPLGTVLATIKRAVLASCSVWSKK